MEKATEYQFLDYRISTARQVLYHQDEQQVISTKAYYLLLKLVESHGEILSKEELIEAVWPNQIVTHAALSKQVLRLRKVINDEDSLNPIIETHRGSGYRFSALVSIKNELNQPLDKVQEKGTTKSAEKPGVRHGKKAIILLFLSFTLLTTFYLSSEQPVIEVSKDEVNLMLVPKNGNESLISEGHLKYLAALLENKSSIVADYPEESWLENIDPQEMAVESVSIGQTNYASLIQVFRQIDRFQIDITLRNKKSKIASTSIQSTDMVELLRKSANWINDELVADERIQLKSPSFDIGFTDDSYALQSYLLGKSAQNSGSDQGKAKEYFEAAVQKDPSFIQAWYELANVKFNMNDFVGTMGIVNTQLPLAISQNDTDVQFLFYYLKATVNYQMQRIQESKDSLKLALSLVEENNNPMDQIKAFRSLFFLAYLSKDWSSAAQYTEEQIKLAEENYPFDEQLGFLNFLKADVNALEYKWVEAREALNKAIYHWSQNHNPENMLSGYGLMNKINLSESAYEQGIKIAHEAKPFLELSNTARPKVFFLYNTTIIFNLRGLFNESSVYIDEISRLADETDNKFFYLVAQFLKIHTFYVQNKFVEALNHAEAIQSVVERDYLLEEAADHYSTVALISSRIEPPEVALMKMNEMKVRYPELFIGEPNTINGTMRRAQAHLQIRLGQIDAGLTALIELERNIRDIGEMHVANYVGFEILEVMLEHPGRNYQTVIDRLDQYTNFDYLFFKLKAQFKAKEGDYLTATTLMQENKLKANQLWSVNDQLLLESYKEKLDN